MPQKADVAFCEVGKRNYEAEEESGVVWPFGVVYLLGSVWGVLL